MALQIWYGYYTVDLVLHLQLHSVSTECVRVFLINNKQIYGLESFFRIYPNLYLIARYEFFESYIANPFCFAWYVDFF